MFLVLTRNGQGNGLGVAVDLGDVGRAVGVRAGAVGTENVVVVVAVAVGLNILGGKLLVAAVRAARRILTIDVHLQQNR